MGTLQFLTGFYEKVEEDAFLAEKVGGHRDKRDIERYNHIRELIGRERVIQQSQARRFSLVGSQGSQPNDSGQVGIY